MKAKTAFAITVGLGLLVFIPVAVVVGLGLYGSSLGGATTARSVSGAELTLVPAKGLPGTVLKIQGRNWPARTTISLFLTRPKLDAGHMDLRMRIADVVASRSGGFEIDAFIPASVIPRGTDQVFVEAAGRSLAGDLISTSLATFTLEPYPTMLKVKVTNSITGLPVEGAEVAVEDGFGQTIAIGTTGPSGQADLAGLRPGKLVVGVKRLDYMRQSTAVTLRDAGEHTVPIDLQHRPSRRLYLPAAQRMPDGSVRLRGIDRSSGLQFEQLAPEGDTGFAPVGNTPGVLLFSYFLATDEGPNMESGPSRAVNSLWALGTIGRQIANNNAYPTLVWHLASTARGEIIYATEGSYANVHGTTLLIVEPVTNKVLLRRPFSPSVLVPAISDNGEQVYLLNWVAREVQVMDLALGKIVATHAGLPDFIGHTLAAPSRQGLYLLSTRDGLIFHLDTTTGEFSEPLLEIPGAVLLSNMPDGRLVVATGPEASLVLADPVEKEIIGIIPLHEPAHWLWVDPDGPFIYVGHYNGDEGFSVQLIDALTMQPVEQVEFKYDG